MASLIGPAAADPLTLTRQTCTTLNCGSLSLVGRINAHPTSPAIANSWVGQFAAAASSCLRFHVTAETRDLAMTVVSRNGTVYTNDAGGVASCAACPRVVVGAAINSIYTVVVSDTLGAGIDSSFTMRVGLYNAGNSPNCLAPTPGR